MWGDIQDIFLFGCPKTIDITGFFKKFCIATRTKKKDTTQVVSFFLGSAGRRPAPPFGDLNCSGEMNSPCAKVFACGENACTAHSRRPARRPASARSYISGLVFNFKKAAVFRKMK